MRIFDSQDGTPWYLGEYGYTTVKVIRSSYQHVTAS